MSVAAENGRDETLGVGLFGGGSVGAHAPTEPTETASPVIGATLATDARPIGAYANRPTTVASSTVTRPALLPPSRSSSASASAARCRCDRRARTAPPNARARCAQSRRCRGRRCDRGRGGGRHVRDDRRRKRDQRRLGRRGSGARDGRVLRASAKK